MGAIVVAVYERSSLLLRAEAYFQRSSRPGHGPSRGCFWRLGNFCPIPRVSQVPVSVILSRARAPLASSFPVGSDCSRSSLRLYLSMFYPGASDRGCLAFWEKSCLPEGSSDRKPRAWLLCIPLHPQPAAPSLMQGSIALLGGQRCWCSCGGAFPRAEGQGKGCRVPDVNTLGLWERGGPPADSRPYCACFCEPPPNLAPSFVPSLRHSFILFMHPIVLGTGDTAVKETDHK